MNPYKIEGPALISFSGGRTSAYMLYQILQAQGGELPKDYHVVFANTGKEMPQTLDFVRDCENHWGVEVTWLELSGIKKDGKGPTEKDKEWMFKYKKTDYKNCSRNGEPFEMLIKHYGKLPNATNRYCTYLLKQRAITWYERVEGLDKPDQILGLRYDEPHRVHRIKARKGKQQHLCPLYHAKITHREVKEFWDKNNFDLNLIALQGHTQFGNCDMCFLKGKRQLLQMLKHRKDLADWWVKQEEKTNKTFKYDISYKQMLNLNEKANKQQELFFDDESVDCFCHD